MKNFASLQIGDMTNWKVILRMGVISIIGISSPAIGGENELISKEEWSILQSVEYRYRKSVSEDHLVLVEQSGKHLAGILSADGGQRLWVLLDPVHKPFLKQLPQGDYRISSGEFLKITAFGKVHPEVQSVIKKAIHPAP